MRWGESKQFRRCSVKSLLGTRSHSLFWRLGKEKVVPAPEEGRLSPHHHQNYHQGAELFNDWSEPKVALKDLICWVPTVRLA